MSDAQRDRGQLEDDGQASREGAHIRLALEDGYRFRADFGDGRPQLLMDEPPPLGAGSGPNASAVLGAAVGNCLSASLLFCLRKARVDVEGMAADVDVTVARNERGRLRVSAVHVDLHPELAPGAEARITRCLDLFEDFCVVTEAVRGGIEVGVSVSPRTTGAPPEAPDADQGDRGR